MLLRVFIVQLKQVMNPAGEPEPVVKVELSPFELIFAARSLPLEWSFRRLFTFGMTH